MTSTRTKVILAVILSITLSSFFIFLSTNIYQSQLIESNLHKKIENISQQIAKSITDYEKRVDAYLKASLYGIYSELTSGNITNNRLSVLTKKYDLASIYLIDHEGRISYGSDYNLLLKKGFVPKFSLFDYCPNERDILGSTNIVRTSPMIWVDEVTSPSKYYWTYHNQLKQILEVTYRFEDLDDVLSNIATSHPEISSIALLTPSHKYIAASFSRKMQIENNKKVESIEYSPLKILKQAGSYLAYKSFGPVYYNYCSVKEKEYFYTVQVIYKNNNEDMNILMRKEFVVIFFCSLFLILFLMFYLNKLISGITNLSEIMTNRIRSLKKDDTSLTYFKDEILQLNYLFDTLMASLQEASNREEKLSKYKVIGTTTKMVAHDVRKPFSQLKAVIQMLSMQNSDDELRNKCLGFLPLINNSIESVDNLLIDIMDLGSANKLKLEETSAKKILLETIKACFAYDMTNDVKLTYNFTHSSYLLVDSTRVLRVFFNIVQNAMNVMKRKGTISISTFPKSDRIEFYIRNSNSYVNADDQIKLFDPFYTKGTGGTGLGLAIAKEVVEAHGGKIRCESSKISGTEFIFDLPAGNKNDDEIIELPHWSRELSYEFFRSEINQDYNAIQEKETILKCLLKEVDIFKIAIVDDDKIYTSSICEKINFSSFMNKKVKFNEINFCDKIEDLHNCEQIDLLIVDIDLGGNLSGFDLTQSIRKVNSQTFICIHSNRITADFYQRAMTSGANLVTRKPMTYENLILMIISSIEAKNFNNK